MNKDAIEQLIELRWLGPYFEIHEKLLEVVRIQHEALKAEVECGTKLADTLEAIEDSNRIAREMLDFLQGLKDI